MKDQVTGKVQETAGKVTGDKETEAKGNAKGMMGKAKEKLAEAKDKVAEKTNEVIDDVKEKMDK